MNVVLIGMPGSGKSTILRLYAEKYGKSVFDTDSLIEERYGSISDIFSEYGEKYFRTLESGIIREICAAGGEAVVATGGGAVTRSENIRLFKSFGKIVYLRTGIDALLKRLEGDASRPLLKGVRRQKLERLFSERQKLYEDTADIIVDTDGKGPSEVLDLILKTTGGGVKV